MCDQSEDLSQWLAHECTHAVVGNKVEPRRKECVPYVDAEWEEPVGTQEGSS